MFVVRWFIRNTEKHKTKILFSSFQCINDKEERTPNKMFMTNYFENESRELMIVFILLSRNIIHSSYQHLVYIFSMNIFAFDSWDERWYALSCNKF